MNSDALVSLEKSIEILDFTITNINSQFELWLTITFAVIIASYIAGHRLSKVLKTWFAILYLMVSALLFLMLASSARILQGMLANSEYAFGFEFDDPMGITIVILRILVWLIGTGVTLVFIFRGFREHGSREGEDD